MANTNGKKAAARLAEQKRLAAIKAAESYTPNSTLDNLTEPMQGPKFHTLYDEIEMGRSGVKPTTMPFAPKGDFLGGDIGGSPHAIGAPRAPISRAYDPNTMRKAAGMRKAEIDSLTQKLVGDKLEGIDYLSNAGAAKLEASRVKLMNDFAPPVSMRGAGVKTGVIPKASGFNSTGGFTNFTTKAAKQSPMAMMTGKAGIQRPLEEGLTKKAISSGLSIWGKTNFTHALASNPFKVGIGAAALGAGIGTLGNWLAPNLVERDEHFVRNAIGLGAAAGALAVVPKAIVGASVINKNIPEWAVKGATSLTKNWTKGKGMMLAMGAAGIMGGLETHMVQAINSHSDR